MSYCKEKFRCEQQFSELNLFQVFIWKLKFYVMSMSPFKLIRVRVDNRYTTVTTTYTVDHCYYHIHCR